MITDLQKKAAELLSAGHSIAATAIECGKSRRTIENWRALPEFQKYCEEIWQECEKIDAKSTAESLRRLRGKALEKIEQILNSEDVSARTQLHAAQIVLKFSAETDIRNAEIRGAAQAEKVAQHNAKKRFSKDFDELLDYLARNLPPGFSFRDYLLDIPEIQPPETVGLAEFYAKAVRDAFLVATTRSNQKEYASHLEFLKLIEKNFEGEEKERILEIFDISFEYTDPDENNGNQRPKSGDPNQEKA
jgi:hypothetical protein